MSLVGSFLWSLVGICRVYRTSSSVVHCSETLMYNDFFFILSGVRPSLLGTAATIGLLHEPQTMEDGDCGATDGMKIGRDSRSTRRKRAPVPFCSPQVPHNMTRARTRAAYVGSQRLIAWAMAWLYSEHNLGNLIRNFLYLFLTQFLDSYIDLRFYMDCSQYCQFYSRNYRYTYWGNDGFSMKDI
jgi:hypothetical protein